MCKAMCETARRLTEAQGNFEAAARLLVASEAREMAAAEEARAYRLAAEAAEERVKVLEEALRDVRTTLSVTRGNIMVEEQRDRAHQWEGVPAILRAKMDAIDAALQEAPRDGR